MESCAHCGLPIRGKGFPLKTEEGRLNFCCPGCRLAHQILKAPDLNIKEYLNKEIAEYSPRSTSASDGEVEEAVFDVDGMVCDACVPIVNNVLEKTAGVESSRVNYLTGRLNVAYRPGVVDRSVIKKRLKGYGYRAYEAGERRGDEDAGALMRVSLGLFLAMDVMLLSIPEYLGVFAPGEEKFVPYMRLGMLALTLPVLFWVALPIFRRAAASIAAVRPDMNFLVALGSMAAFGYSVYGTATDGPHVFYETAAFLPVMITLGKALEDRAGRKAREALMGLIDIVPETTTVVRDGKEERLPTETLAPGDKVKISAGQRAPCDGTIISGNVLLDESILTGESMPGRRTEGGNIRAGAFVISGEALVSVEVELEKSALGQVVTSVERAGLYRGARQAVLDRVAAIMVPAVIALGFIAAFSAFVSHLGAEESMLRGLAVILFACPCALGIAAPLARATAIGRAASMGIVVRDAEALEEGGKPTAILLDKTGTLTKGNPVVEATGVAEGVDEESVLSIAASLEADSPHPVAKAVAGAASAKGVSAQEAAGVVDEPGLGRIGEVGGTKYMIGNARLMERESVEIPEWARAMAADLSARGLSVSYLASDKVLGVMGFADEIRPEAEEVIGKFVKAGIRPILATGDHVGAAAPVARRCGITEVHSGLKPDDKRDLLVKLKDEGNVVWAVGDGVNDAPALAVAAVGIAMGGGARLASEAAHLTIAGGGLGALPDLPGLARRLGRVEKQNIVWAVAYNLLGLPAAFFGLLRPVFSAVAMSISSLSVALNSLRLKATNDPGKHGAV